MPLHRQGQSKGRARHMIIRGSRVLPSNANVPPFPAASTLQANPADAVMQYAVELLRRNPLRTGEKGGCLPENLTTLEGMYTATEGACINASPQNRGKSG